MGKLDILKNLYISLGASEMNSEILRSITIILVILITAILADFIAKKILRSMVKRFVEKTSWKYDDIIFQKKVLFYLAHLIPAVIIQLTIDFAFSSKVEYPFNVESISNTIHTMLGIYVFIILWLVIFASINAFHEIFKKGHLAKDIDIKGFLQLIKVIVSLVFIILLVALIVDKKPGAVLTALGAVAAVLMFVFKDTLLGFVAGIQIAANKMVKPGDWISMPDMNADGTVLEIGLTTAKIQNWDKTISTVPTYALVSNSFANWRGMEESGGRRIKRSFFIDVSSIKFCSENMIEKYRNMHLLKSYILEKEKELALYNKEKKITQDNLANSRYLTNVGTFRKYIELYLNEHPSIKKDFTILVRQLQVTPNGLPMEIYVFSSDQRWVQYEAIQSDIFDHIFSVIPEFELRLFQNPTGSDFKGFTN